MTTGQQRNMTAVDLLLDALTVAKRFHSSVPVDRLPASVALASAICQAHASLAQAVLSATHAPTVSAGDTVEPG